MLGAIVGDIIGSRFEWHNIKTKEFTLFTNECRITDDSILTIAIAKAILICNNNYDDLSDITTKCMQEIGRLYPDCGFSLQTRNWIFSKDPHPNNSYGNGAAMRVSACAMAGRSLDEVISLSRKVTKITHNHPEGIKGAEATAVAIFMAKTGNSIQDIRKHINTYYYPMNFTIDEIRENYSFKATCQETVPQAIMSFLESSSFEDSIRNAISIGGDSDTIAAIAGSIAAAYYGIPEEIIKKASSYLDKELLLILDDFDKKFMN